MYAEKWMKTASCYVTEQAGTLSMESKDNDIQYVSYTSELQMPDIMKLIQKDLSEPYSIYTYRYFIHNWPKLCFLVCALQKSLSYVSAFKLIHVFPQVCHFYNVNKDIAVSI